MVSLSRTEHICTLLVIATSSVHATQNADKVSTSHSTLFLYIRNKIILFFYINDLLPAGVCQETHSVYKYYLLFKRPLGRRSGHLPHCPPRLWP